MILRYLFCLFVSAFVFQCASEESTLPPGFLEGGEIVSDRIQLNQVGIYPGATLRFSVIAFDGLRDTLPNGTPGKQRKKPVGWYVTSEWGKVIVAEGKLSKVKDWSRIGGVKAWYVETEAPVAGKYRVFVPGFGYSYEFEVRENVYREALVASIRSNFLQRMGMDLEEKHAGVYAREGGHFDRNVRYHPSTGRSGYTTSPGGWYDAGDYGKYVLNGTFPLAQYLTLKEEFPNLFADGDLNIPESGNGVDDYLDELRYEIDWLLSMQDRDGGVFHKLTTLAFDKMIMPAETTEQRYIIGKSTEATLNYAAALAQASRVYASVDEPFADQLIASSTRAYAWAKEHPAEGFINPEDVSTGQYGDTDFQDERAFAAAELYVTTGEEKYLTDFQLAAPRPSFKAGGGWKTFMSKLALFSLSRNPVKLPGDLRANVELSITNLADSLIAEAAIQPFAQPISNFRWGSNSDVMNAGMIAAAAHRISGDAKYLELIRAGVDYVLGHNPVGYSYVTGFGDRAPMFIHHRPSIADDIAQPFPGFLSGGPNPSPQDSAWATYQAGVAPMQSWVDQEGSYASNEICLNWNASLTYILGYLEANQ